MKIYIYIVLFVILLFYVKSHSNCVNEKFTDKKSINNLDAPNPYDVLKTNKVKSIFIEGNSELVPGYDYNSTNIYSEKYWNIKSKGFSDIYNYEDNSTLHLFLKNNTTESEVIDETPKEKVEEEEVKEEKVEEKKNVNIFEFKSNKYNLIGTASNEYYSQYYYLYEFSTKQKNNLDYEENLDYIKNNRIYEYLLVKNRKNKLEVSHYIGPRNKININDVVYFSLGNFQLGPLVIKKN